MIHDTQAPIAIRLLCPICGEPHVDEGELATKPHHTHACQACGHVWRPAVVATVGVRFLPGFKNEPPPKVVATNETAAEEHPEDRQMRLEGERYGHEHAAEFVGAHPIEIGSLIATYSDEGAHDVLDSLRALFWARTWVPAKK